MIPQDFISEWKKAAPWSQNDQVEQDLVVCRALVEIFSHPVLAENLAFRGGTALFKLHLPPVRYSEDIDLVQVHPGPIGAVMSALQEKLNPWLGNPKRKQGEGRVTLTYRVTSEEGAPLKLKVEIGEGIQEADVPGIEKEIVEKMHRMLHIRPAITWLKPFTLERASKKTQLLEKQYQS